VIYPFRAGFRIDIKAIPLPEGGDDRAENLLEQDKKVKALSCSISI